MSVKKNIDLMGFFFFVFEKKVGMPQPGSCFSPCLVFCVASCRFYTLLVLSTALFGKPPFKNVIVNGLVLAR